MLTLTPTYSFLIGGLLGFAGFYLLNAFQVRKLLRKNKLESLEATNAYLKKKLDAVQEESNYYRAKHSEAASERSLWQAAFMAHKMLHLGLSPSQIDQDYIEIYQEKLAEEDDPATRAYKRLTVKQP